jgi:hypothetical protein
MVACFSAQRWDFKRSVWGGLMLLCDTLVWLGLGGVVLGFSLIWEPQRERNTTWVFPSWEMRFSGLILIVVMACSADSAKTETHDEAAGLVILCPFFVCGS